MPTPSHVVTCTENRRIANGVYEIRFTKPEGFTFVPGQFLMFDVPAVSDPADLQPRAYSVASHPSEPDILLVVRLKAGGRASEWIEKVLQPGMHVSFKGPMGLFKLRTDSHKDILFISTGAGIAPFRPMILQALRDMPDRRIDLIQGVSLAEDLFWQEEFAALSQKHPKFVVHYTLSRPAGEWKGRHGRVQEIVPVAVPDITSRCVYVCGNPDMTIEVKKLCLEQWGVPKEDFHMEGYV
jgi:ferredoxin-NADP reductase